MQRWGYQIKLAGKICRNKSYPILVVRYEDIKADTLVQVRRILDFLEFNYMEQKLTERIREGYSSFYRNHTDNFEHFTPQQNAFINAELNKIVSVLHTYNVSGLFRIDQYVNT